MPTFAWAYDDLPRDNVLVTGRFFLSFVLDGESHVAEHEMGAVAALYEKRRRAAEDRRSGAHGMASAENAVNTPAVGGHAN